MFRHAIRQKSPGERLSSLASIEELSDEAERFLHQCYTELDRTAELPARCRAVAAAIRADATYDHTFAELEYGARVAWRNSSRCIGRLYWQSLRLRDRRATDRPLRIGEECVGHLREATNDGRIRPTITVFAPDRPDRPGPRIRNEQLIRYAGYRVDDGGPPEHGKTLPAPRALPSIVGDPRNIALTDSVRALGWYGHGTAFDILPLVIEAEGYRPYVHVLPQDCVLEIPLSHPRHPWFADLGIRWHAVPAISDMCLEVGGLHYSCAPFNGWYMGTEIGSRNLADADRYDLLPAVAANLGLDTTTDRTLWRDRALVELNVAVLHSYEQAGVTMTDHHTEAHRFLKHVAKEERAGRVCPAEWSWIVPPLSGGATAVFHRYYDEADVRPNFVRHGPEGHGPERHGP
ncbi:nitric-oxide synthase [Catenulispora sp. GAS73]|uniref:nitric oxide synthase oxygenase n=1 Tax=Catenulispora sp. GAS73 TaxID=3156269 RepID=UPI003514CF8A